MALKASPPSLYLGAVLCYLMPHMRTEDHNRPLLAALKRLRPYWRITLGAYLGMLATVGLAVIIPQFIRFIIDEAVGKDNIALLSASVLALLGLTAVKGVISYGQGRWTETASQGVAYDLRRDIHHKLAALSFSYHDRAETGQLLSRAIQDVERIRFLTGRALLRLVEGAVLAVATFATLYVMNARLATLTMAIVPLLAINAYVFGRQLRPLGLRIQRQLAALTIRLEQNLRGARIVKAFGQEDAEMARFVSENKRWSDLSVRQATLQARNDPQLEFIANVGTTLVIGFGGWLAIQGQPYARRTGGLQHLPRATDPARPPDRRDHPGPGHRIGCERAGLRDPRRTIRSAR